MSLLDISAILLTLAAIFGYLNHRLLKLPNSIGIMLIGLLVSLGMILLGQKFEGFTAIATRFVSQIDFNETLMKGMLSYLLFAGALHVNLSDLKMQRRLVAILATAGVLLSTCLIGFISYYVFQWCGLDIPLPWCFVFGSLISPTDPVAVLGILRKAGVPKSLETKITGESLFNDGVGVVIYLVLLSYAIGSGSGQAELDLAEVGTFFLQEAGGGILLGAIAGGLCFYLLRSIDNYQVELLITLALVTGGYSLASYWHLSGPLAMVVAGLMIGNHGRRLAMSDVTRQHVDLFWELIDEVLNALLFLLIGLEIFIIAWTDESLMAGGILIIVTLLCRFTAISIPVAVLQKFRSFTPGVTCILTWGGLRGGISVALALAIPREGVPDGVRDGILVATYVIVIFSIAVQGLTLRPLVSRILAKGQLSDEDRGVDSVIVSGGDLEVAGEAGSGEAPAATGAVAGTSLEGEVKEAPSATGAPDEDPARKDGV
ncbi:MAG: cation:proton antiporter [Verrucomicrobiales bacterium]